MKYFTIILQHDEMESLEAARAMSSYIADRIDLTTTLTISENQLSEIVKERFDERIIERTIGIARQEGD